MDQEERYCSFCGKTIDESNILFSGNDGHICADCLKRCNDELEKNQRKVNEYTLSGVPKPKEIKEFLDKYIIGQDKVKERISVAVYNHYKRINTEADNDVEIDKSNILVVGPTGSGKTLIAKTVAKLLNVPFCIGDATVLTESGYVGEDVESLLVNLYQAADYDIEKTERGIVFIDEIDKIARKGDSASISRDVSGEGVQQGLLKLLEGSIVSIPPKGGRKHPDTPLVKINTKNILFICGGAFVGIEDKIKNRCNKQVIGFNSPTKTNIDETDYLDMLNPIDLKSFGLIPEIIGRLPIITHTNELNRDALIRILKEPKNALVKQYKKLFSLDNVNLEFTDEALEYIVDKTLEYKLGARGLRNVMENVMNSAMFNVPSTDDFEIIVDLDYVKKHIE